MSGRQLVTALVCGALGLSGLALLLPNRLGRALVAAADRLASELAAAVEDAMDVFEEEIA